MIANDDAKRARRSIGISWGKMMARRHSHHSTRETSYAKTLLQTIWGPDHGEGTENLRVVINQLRKKIEKDPTRPRYILTEPWLGYRLQLPIVACEKPPRRNP